MAMSAELLVILTPLVAQTSVLSELCEKGIRDLVSFVESGAHMACSGNLELLHVGKVCFTRLKIALASKLSMGG